MLRISPKLFVLDNEIEITAIHSHGTGGQNVNKVATAIHLRFDINNSSLPDLYKDRLLKLKDRRITKKDGIIIIKAQQQRSQKQNRDLALNRLQSLIQTVLISRKKRKPTKPTLSSKIKRLDSKTKKGQLKVQRKKVDVWD